MILLTIYLLQLFVNVVNSLYYNSLMVLLFDYVKVSSDLP